MADGKSQTTDRSPKDYAIEFGGYLADAADQVLALRDDMDPDEINDTWRALQSAVHEFRKRALRAEHGVG